MLLTVDAGTGMVVGTDLLEPVPSLEAMWGSVPLAVTQQPIEAPRWKKTELP